MPSDFLTEYNRRFREFQMEMTRNAYLQSSGQKEKSEIRFLLSEYSDLFSELAIQELHQEYEAVAEYRENERAPIKSLIAFATKLFVASQIRELTEEIEDFESQARIIWEGEPLNLSQSLSLLANESDPVKRREIHRRRVESLKGSFDLHAEKLEKAQAAAQKISGRNYLQLSSQSDGIDYEKLALETRGFLAQTEGRYLAALSPYLTREAGIALSDATSADIFYLQQSSQSAEYFPAWRLNNIYRETFSGLGIRTYNQKNLIVDETPRPKKESTACHFPIDVPDEIRVIFSPGDGAAKYSSFFYEIGQAQRYAWTSHNLHPVFQYTGDPSLGKGFALLLASLLSDKHWLGEMLGYYKSKEFRYSLSLLKVIQIRRAIGHLSYEVDLQSEKISAATAGNFSELMNHAVQVHFDKIEYFREFSDNFSAAHFLRACAFEAQLCEFLKTKFGSRWWASRKAGDFLIEIWNTGGRYEAGELAKLIDLGELSFDWLAEVSIRSLRE